MSNQKTMYYLGSLALLLGVMGIMAAINYGVNLRPFRWDLTAGKRFTLSESTRRLLSELPDVVSVKAVYSSNIPTIYTEYINEVKDLLHEYENASRGKLRVEEVDPADNPELQAELSKLGINPVILPVAGLDQAATLKVYASIYVEHLEKSELLPNVISVENLEYDLTATIQRMVAKDTPHVGIFNVDENRKVREEFATLVRILEKQFIVDEVNTSDGEPVDPIVKVLIVPTPFRATERDLFAIDQFIMAGGQTIFLVDGVQVFLQPGPYGNMMPFYAMALNEEIDSIGKLLAHYGVKRNYDLVQDKLYQNYPILGPLGRPYPLFPMIDFIKTRQEEHPITQGLDYLALTWASSLELQTLPDTVKAVRLAVTTTESWLQSGGQLMVDPMKEPMPPLPIPGMGPAERTVAVLLSGRFRSYFEGKPVPEVEEEETGEGLPKPPPPERHDESPDTNILVVGCSKFVSEQSPIQLSQNYSFILSAVEWMAGGRNLADIRKRVSDVRPIGKLSVQKMVLILLVAPLAAPVAVIIFGVARFAYRSSQKKKFLERV